MDDAVVKHARRLLGHSRRNLRKGRTLFDKIISAFAQNNLGNQMNNQSMCCTIMECTLRNSSCIGKTVSEKRQRVGQHEEKRCYGNEKVKPSAIPLRMKTTCFAAGGRGTKGEHMLNLSLNQNFQTTQAHSIPDSCQKRIQILDKRLQYQCVA